MKERLSKFDGASMVFEYEAVEGVPSFVSYAVNRWSVEQAGDRSAIVRIHATLVLRGPARLFSWLVKWQMQAAGARVGEELKHFIEHGRHHPRKQATLEATARQAF